ncbi:transcriptional repressor [Sphingobacterium psychroaquaticum]|uniref:Fur family transcriptional regulator, ferric uptake regulator n=2 Tax=Sphingobacterium psychroaquaticum TaxID=561061 RepID=A0A1X7KQP1_9SPHI|nr:transcriptional repressor [Sphingobacterium psychroaquaticum]SMG43885.1 Fur family transcriptional regulator, ferric uptake regulator [Sphingobacterium psychroaquaticum]
MMEKRIIKQEDFAQLLKQNGLKVTPHRLRVLEEITQKDAAISQPDLEKTLGKEIDRVTLYRILASFEEKGIVHKIFDLHGTATYAACAPGCSQNHHHDQHVHFICSVCNSVYCLEEISLPKIQLPAKFNMQSLAINAVGLCADCQKED